MLLAEIRQAAGMTQEEVAASLGIKQPTLSRIESQDDMQVSTLQRLVEARAANSRSLRIFPAAMCGFASSANRHERPWKTPAPILDLPKRRLAAEADPSSTNALIRSWVKPVG